MLGPVSFPVIVVYVLYKDTVGFSASALYKFRVINFRNGLLLLLFSLGVSARSSNQAGVPAVMLPLPHVLSGLGV